MAINYCRSLLLWLVAGICLIPCASFGGMKDMEEECVTESCLMPKLQVFPINMQSYLQVKDSFSHGFRPEEASRSFRENFATVASFAGDYGAANRFYPLPELNKDPLGHGYSHAVPAAKVVRMLAKDRRAVFINEAHAVARTRAAIYTLLRPLREEGYSYLALEGLTTYPVDKEKNCANSLLNDPRLPTRGYATGGTGFYLNEPIFGEIIREALRLKFKLVAYEDASDSDDGLEAREQRQAENIACIFKADKEAKIMVIAGFGHIAKNPVGAVHGGMMAARFKAMTGIDPLTVDTTKLLRARTYGFHFDGQDVEKYPSQGYALSDSKGRFFGSVDYDLMLLFPDTPERGEPGTSWLELDGARQDSLVSAGGCMNIWPCLIQAFPQEEVSGIPADGCVIERSQDTCHLFLPKGVFGIKYFNRLINGIQSDTISIDP
ncbi:MAG: hypothetical protein KUL77_02300 [Thermomonas sp.]|uniref:hypothetical protein n=1 Tax=Thermomonas sp. TaxID=1971895 RepID=UPI001EC0FD50|nr:hypothetical protein [Thermomonas sp.]MBV2208378.1 hypothetical protein [Thermomonas sp.]